MFSFGGIFSSVDEYFLEEVVTLILLQENQLTE